MINRVKADRNEFPMRGMQTKDVVRIGHTVRRPCTDRTADVHRLLRHLEATGQAIAPRPLGIDAEGRQMLSYIPGRVINRTPAGLSNARLRSAAALIRQFHDATAGTPLARDQEIVMHTDLGPHNIVFAGPKAVGIIDWDEARPGSRLVDFAHAAWCCADICTGVPVQEQSRKLWLFCANYGWAEQAQVSQVVDELAARFQRAADAHVTSGRGEAARIFETFIRWMGEYGGQLKIDPDPALGSNLKR
ncbi:aminoglycoside phosphotransferase family protein [Mesorhizobium koreense]|uniref:aminoglycoside phosphotransferase family protein n=1 Tax=Mesorhizobium koreense TaxID=3074855 RepID=UPI00287B60BE|nr:aminoglycoside phosphotransferase family protein [Mesorhizobium sp. WR6]